MSLFIPNTFNPSFSFLSKIIRCQTCDKLVDRVVRVERCWPEAAVVVQFECHGKEHIIKLSDGDLRAYLANPFGEPSGPQTVEEIRSRLGFNSVTNEPRQEIYGQFESVQSRSSATQAQMQPVRAEPRRERQTSLSSRPKEKKIQKPSKKVIARFPLLDTVLKWTQRLTKERV